MTKKNKETAVRTRFDPRQQYFLSYYLDPKSITFANATRSAIRAGYSELYAGNIMADLPEWLREKLGAVDGMLVKAERNLQEFLELPNETQAMGMYGPVFQTIEKKVQAGKFKNGKPRYKKVKEKKPVMKLDSKIMKIKQDSSHFIAERLGRIKYGPKVTENANFFNINVFPNEQRIKVAKRIIGGGSGPDRESQKQSD